MTNTAALPPQERTLTKKEWIGFIGLVLGMFMSVLDVQIVASSLPHIQAGLAATADEGSWIQTSYLIAEVMMIPLSGWLARTLSTRYLFMTAASGFTILSFACACAWDINSMIIFRMLQGFFGGAMIPTVFAVVFTLFPRKMQPTITIIIGLVVTMAPTIGPVIGGYLTENISWHILFTMNILPGMWVVFSTWKFVDVDKPNFELLKSIDFLGILYICLFLCCLEYVLEEGSRKGWFDSDIILTVACISAFGGVMLFYHELTTPRPIIDLRAFKNANFALGSTFSFIIGCGLYTVIYLLPTYLATIKQLNSMQVGFYMMVTGMFQFCSAPIAGILAKKIDLRLLLSMGLTLFGIGTWLNSNLSNDVGYAELFLPQAIRGMSLMMCFMPINIITFATLKPDQVKNASGLYNLMRNLGGAIGLAVASTCLISWQKGHYAVLRENVTPANPVLPQIMSATEAKFAEFSIESPELAAIQSVYQLAMREATILTYIDLFRMVSLLFFIALLAVPFLKKASATDGPSDAH